MLSLCSLFALLRKLVYQDSKLVIFDIFNHNNTAKFFDAFIARACITGHEISCLTKEFASSLCAITGWSEPEFHDIDLRWHFESEQHIGNFLALLLANKPLFSEIDSMEATKKHLGICEADKGFILNWPMTMMLSSPLRGYQ